MPLIRSVWDYAQRRLPAILRLQERLKMNIAKDLIESTFKLSKRVYLLMKSPPSRLSRREKNKRLSMRMKKQEDTNKIKFQAFRQLSAKLEP